MCYMRRQHMVAVRALRQNLSVYLRRVEAGEAFQVTAGDARSHPGLTPRALDGPGETVAPGARPPAGDLLKLGRPRGGSLSA
jgi:hypothetical protein